jgi:ABC-type glycerol-3-phosphate transport system permease component
LPLARGDGDVHGNVRLSGFLLSLIIATLLVMVVFLVFQRQFIRGIALTGIRG